MANTAGATGTCIVAVGAVWVVLQLTADNEADATPIITQAAVKHCLTGTAQLVLLLCVPTILLEGSAVTPTQAESEVTDLQPCYNSLKRPA